MPAQLAVDRGRCVGREGDAAGGVVAARGRDETERPDLHEVLERLAPTGVTTCQTARKRQTFLDQPLTFR